MKRFLDLAKFALTVLLMGATVALAVFDPVNDDTDIFLANPTIAAERPNVLLVVDNTANWNAPFANEKNALVQVINGLTDQYNVGLMIMSDSNIKRSSPTSSDGSYVRYHVRQMTATNKTRLSSLINAFDINGDKGDNNMAGMALYEAYLYFAGKATRASDDQSKADHDGTADPFLSPLTGHALPGPDGVGYPVESSLFRSPIIDGCARNFIIFISNGPANENASQRAELEGYLGTLTGVSPPSVISITPNGQQANWADEMAKFMANADVFATSASVPNSSGVQNVYTYVVEVDPGTTGQGLDMTALAKSMAVNGKGKYFGVTSGASGTAIVDALNAIFSEVQAVNSVFASTTLPVSVNVRGTNLNQVYIGVFRPDANKSPRWLGNLKMYNLAFNTATNTVFLADAANGPPPAVGNVAENSSTGFISPTSPSFWTTSSTYWGFRDASLNGPGGASDYPDGDLVEKGGAAQQLRIHFANAEASVLPRKLYTCTTGTVSGVLQTCAANSLLSNTPFTTLNDAISAAALQLDTRLVSPLTAFETKPIVALTDRRVATISNANPGVTVNVASMTNGAITQVITSLTTAAPLVITGTVTSDVQGFQTRSINSIIKDTGNTWVAQAGGALPSAYVVGATVSFSGFANNNWNGVSFSITAVNTTSNTISFTRTGNPGNGAAGTASVAATVPSTTARVTFPSHGFADGALVTIQGATPTEYNRSNVGITVQDADHFTYPLLTAPSVTGNATGTITVSGNTTTATATFAAPHGFLHGTTVTISGASDPAYNGAKTISCTAGNCTGQNTFTYSVGATPIGPNTASPVYAVQSGSTTVTVTTTGPHGFLDSDSVVITGSDIAGYNGTWRISCPGGCFPVPPFPGFPPVAPTVFTFNTQTDFVAPTVAINDPLPANNSTSVTASLAGATVSTVTATVANHGYTAGSQVVIESTSTPADTIHPGTYTILAVPDANTFTYSTGAVLVAPTGNFTSRPPSLSSRAIVTVTGHGYAAGQEVTIRNAVPTAYNGARTITRIVDANNFEYGMTSAPGANTSATATSSKKTTTARATAVNHGFANGSKVTIAGASPSAFNSVDTSTDFTITVVDANTFTYTIPTPQGDATGSITAGQATGVSAERDLIIRWVRGEDNFEDENINSTTTDIRASVHGDVLHSRPAVVNYNRFSGSDDDVFIYYGGNDGIFHAIKGGYTVPTGDASGLTPGKEAWGFVANEFFGQLRRLRNNAPAISSSFKRPYFMDGPIGVFTLDANSNDKLGDIGDKVNLYIANRRGGRFLYALDVNNPIAPKFLWKIDSGTTGFSELGYTWSQPTVVSGLLNLADPLLVFGAGYDPVVEDIDPSSVTSVDTTTGSVTAIAGTFDRSMGRGIYVVDALTGALIWSAGPPGSGATLEVNDMIYAIPSDVTIIRNETTGVVNRGYVGDTGGQMWRIDFRQDTSVAAMTANPKNLNLTTVTKIASIADQSTVSGRRKFLFPPDVVGETGYDAILVGSGDREHPFDTLVTNRFYMFKDKGNDAGPVTGTTACEPAITEAAIPDPADACAPNPGDIPGMSDLTSNCLQDASACLAGETQSGVSTKLGTDRGWYITLGTGEKVVGNAVSIGGTTFFNTNQPSSTAGGGTCGSNLGIARQYQVAAVDATATSDLNAVGGLTGADRSLIHPGGGYLPSPVHVVVMLDGKPVEAVISGVQVSTPAGAALSTRLRKFWYKEVDFK